jgi:hypothetical protein
MKDLVIADTALLVVSTGIAMSLWMEVLPLAPVLGSLAEFIPTAIIPHILFHSPLAKAKEKKLGELESSIDALLSKTSEASFGDGIRFQALLREEEKVSRESTWLVDLRAVVELIGVTFAHLIITQGLTKLLNI